MPAIHCAQRQSAGRARFSRVGVHQRKAIHHVRYRSDWPLQHPMSEFSWRTKYHRAGSNLPIPRYVANTSSIFRNDARTGQSNRADISSDG